MDKTIADLRIDYTKSGLVETDVDPNPFKQFKKWFDQALAAQLPEPNAMTLATVSQDGKPRARIVLLKNFNEQGFVFYTNYNSQKSQEIAQNPWAALIFWWAELERQVRIEGNVEKVAESESDEYFYSRPVGSQLGAWASQQSRVIDNREVLEHQLQELQEIYQNQNIPRPPHWGGYRIVPQAIEFWQGRTNRLHDRLYYSLQEDQTWVIKRLSP
ncbi:MAG TPA: pyridoxamine 5'-phosphate oxidase [Candidatus Sericytochromatia bacterium]